MKLRLMAWLLLSLASAAEASEPTSGPVAACRQAPRAWLGLKLVKPGEMVAAQLRELPAGMGFLIAAVEKNGPGDAAGLQELDVLWKIRDQMLVNESQLAALLRLSHPGEKIALTVFRGGQPLEIAVTLGDAPDPGHAAGGDRCEKSSEVVHDSGKSASYAVDGHTAVVSREGELYHVEIRGTDGSVVFDGRLTPEEGNRQIPKGWRRRVQVLCRTLDCALDGSLPPRNTPRPRVVPPPAENP